jgi:hypothetical protein
MEILVIFSGFGRRKTKPILFSPQHCWGLKTYLKKQSQFYRSLFGVLRTATRNLKKQSQIAERVK